MRSRSPRPHGISTGCTNSTASPTHSSVSTQKRRASSSSDSPRPAWPESEKPARYKALVNLYSSLRNYPKVIDYGNRALKVSRDPEVQVTLGQAYFLTNDNKSAMRVMNEVMASIEQRGAVPKEQQLLLVRAACEKVQDNACVDEAV